MSCFQASDAPTCLSQLSWLGPAPPSGSAIPLPRSSFFYFPRGQARPEDATGTSASEGGCLRQGLSQFPSAPPSGRRATQEATGPPAHPARSTSDAGRPLLRGSSASRRTPRLLQALPPRQSPAAPPHRRRRAQLWASQGPRVWALRGSHPRVESTAPRGVGGDPQVG